MNGRSKRKLEGMYTTQRYEIKTVCKASWVDSLNTPGAKIIVMFILSEVFLIVVLPHLILMALGKHVLQANAFCVSLPVANW